MCPFSILLMSKYLTLLQHCSKVFKSLVDCSIITVRSFDTKKKQRLTKYILCGNVDDTSSQSREIIVYMYKTN